MSAKDLRSIEDTPNDEQLGGQAPRRQNSTDGPPEAAVSRSLRVLLVEDVETDAVLVLRALRKGGFQPDCQRVDTAEAMAAALDQKSWDVVLSDCALPAFSGQAALQLLREREADVPFLVVSGAIGEEVAVQMLKAGAHDYIMKDRLGRLAPAVERELREAEVRRARRSAEAALRGSEAKFRTLFEASRDALMLLDETGFFDCNQATLDLFGFSTRDQFMAKHPAELSPPTQSDGTDSRAAAGARIAAAQATGSQFFEWRHQRADGTVFPAEVLLNQIELNGRPVIHAVVRDLTERKRAEAERTRMEIQLRQAQKLEAIGQLAAGIAHEINTPTQYIGDNTRFLEEAFGHLQRLVQAYEKVREAIHAGTPLDEPLAKLEHDREQIQLPYLLEEIPSAIRESREGLERVTLIVRAMKDFSHPGTTRKTPTNLNRAIESTLTVSRNEWKYVADTVTEFDPELPLVPCLPGEFNQVILNLVVNAAHAIADVVQDGSRRKGKITVSTRQLSDWVEIRVQDTGTGIPKPARDRVFEPFFTTKPVGKGTGQGLAIARSVVVDKHGGTISFETEEGRGTTFLVRLPLKDQEPLNGKKTSEAPNSLCG